jgi:hypothetical protein
MKPLLRNLLILATVTVLGIVANKVLPASSSKAPTAAAAHGEAHEEQQSATLNDAKLIAAGIEVDTVASAVLKETLSVNLTRKWSSRLRHGFPASFANSANASAIA